MSRLTSLYNNSPLLVQHAMVSAQGFNFRYRRSDDRELRRYFQFLRHSEKWNVEQHTEHQVKSLHALIRHAATAIPHYAGLKALDIRAIESVKDIRQLPILEKAHVKGNEVNFVPSYQSISKLYAGRTSGTTGTPMIWYEDSKSFARRTAFVARLRAWAKINNPLYPKRAQFTGRNIVPPNYRGTVFWRHNLPGRALLLSSSHVSVDRVEFYCRALNRFKPELLDGYPSSILMLARLASDLGLELPHLTAIITTAETLTDDVKAEIEQAFRAPVFNQYSSSESTAFASTCEFGTMHIHPEFGIIEILNPDGTPTNPGGIGEIVTTSLINPNMPLIRYRLGDLAEVPIRPSACACGREMPQLKRIIGRQDDILYFPERGYLSRLASVYTTVEGIVEAQLIQETLDRVRILVVPVPGTKFADSELLKSNLRNRIGSNVQICIQEVSRIPRSANGKFRSVVSHCRDEYPRQA